MFPVADHSFQWIGPDLACDLLITSEWSPAGYFAEKPCDPEYRRQCLNASHRDSSSSYHPRPSYGPLLLWVGMRACNNNSCGVSNKARVGRLWGACPIVVVAQRLVAKSATCQWSVQETEVRRGIWPESTGGWWPANSTWCVCVCVCWHAGPSPHSLLQNLRLCIVADSPLLLSHAQWMDRDRGVANNAFCSVRTREVPLEEYCMLLTDHWLASLMDHLVTTGKILAWTVEFTVHWLWLRALVVQITINVLNFSTMCCSHGWLLESRVSYD